MNSMKRAPLQHPTQVRLPKPLKTRLSEASERFGLPSSELIRRALEWKLPEWEQTGDLLIRSSGGRGGSKSKIAARVAGISLIAGLTLFALSANAPVTDQDDVFTNRAVATSVD